MNVAAYLESIRIKLATSGVVSEVIIVRETHTEHQGFFRARLRLQNGDFLEVSEFFEVVNNQAQTKEYRHQWMDPSMQQLRRRWDNAPHYPNLPRFPHHVHVESESRVEPGNLLCIIALIEWFESDFFE
jgi:hypothetical protein